MTRNHARRSNARSMDLATRCATGATLRPAAVFVTRLAKSAAEILAENGAAAPELRALFGWSKLETAKVYVRATRGCEWIYSLEGYPVNASVPPTNKACGAGTMRGRILCEGTAWRVIFFPPGEIIERASCCNKPF